MDKGVMCHGVSMQITSASVWPPKRMEALYEYSTEAANPLPIRCRKAEGGGGTGQPPPNVAFALTM